LIPDASTPPFDSALNTLLLSARFAFLTEDFDGACVAAPDSFDMAAGSLLCDHALAAATRINVPPASPSVLFACIAVSVVSMRHGTSSPRGQLRIVDADSFSNPHIRTLGRNHFADVRRQTGSA
jgi:hypothetical protein